MLSQASNFGFHCCFRLTTVAHAVPQMAQARQFNIKKDNCADTPAKVQEMSKKLNLNLLLIVYHLKQQKTLAQIQHVCKKTKSMDKSFKFGGMNRS